jgi:carboxylate-amine ligase
MSLTLTPPAAAIPFRPSGTFSLGVEEELLMVSPGSFRSARGADAVLARLAPADGTIAGEVSDGVLALATPVCAGAGEAAAALARLRAEARAAVDLIGAGVHPLERFGDVLLRDGERPALIAESLRGLVRQAPRCGVRIHVGMPDGDTAVRALNGLRPWIPLLQALAANSPYWYGEDSGLASARSVISGSFPRSGIPRAFADYDDYAATVGELVTLGDCPDFSYCWWDVRPHPGLGTLEIRACDAQSSLESLTGLVALAHCLAVHAATEEPEPGPSPEALAEISFGAVRDGLDARLPLEGRLVPASHVARHAVALAAAYAGDLGCWEELMLVHRIVEGGNGADRRRADARRGGVRELLHGLVAETAAMP